MMGRHACVCTHAHMCLSMCMYSVNVHVYPCSFSHVLYGCVYGVTVHVYPHYAHMRVYAWCKYVCAFMFMLTCACVGVCMM